MSSVRGKQNIKKEKEMEKKELIRKAQREYKRKWRLRNPNKEKEYAERYWLKVAEKMEREESDVRKNGEEQECFSK